MIQDNHSNYVKRQTPGVPRGGQALCHGLVYCGECGHQLKVASKPRPRYQCRALHERQRAPVCQNLVADSIDAAVVRWFFEALQPLELDAYEQARVQFANLQTQTTQAHQQQLERLRYQAQLAERQFHRADPDHRLVAGELEKRWEETLRQLQHAEEAWQREQARLESCSALPADWRRLFTEAGQAIPTLWQQEQLTPPQKKALLRCLIDKVVAHRSAADTIHVRVVWKGGAATECDLLAGVLAVAQLPFAKEMTKAIVTLARQGKTDKESAAALTERGYHSPQHPTLLPATVEQIRLREGVIRYRNRSQRNRVAGYLSVSEVANRLAIPVHWIYSRIYDGTIRVRRHRLHRLYLFPDGPKTLKLFRQLWQGELQKVRF